jgi:hypothetical protein
MKCGIDRLYNKEFYIGHKSSGKPLKGFKQEEVILYFEDYS